MADSEWRTLSAGYLFLQAFGSGGIHQEDQDKRNTDRVRDLEKGICRPSR